MGCDRQVQEASRSAVSPQVPSLIGAPTELLQKVLDTIPQKVFWKDTSSVYLGCNKLFASVAGLPTPGAIIGLTDFDLPWSSAETEFYRACDRRVIESNQAELGIVESQLNAHGEMTWIETNKAPLHDDNGRVIGVLGTFHDITKLKEAETALQRSNEDLESLVEERTRELQYVARHDGLTGLNNREYFMQQLGATVIDPTVRRFTLLFIDLDGFKTINDTKGHEAGDQLLVQVGQIFKSTTRSTDVVGRFGGDEFLLLLRETSEQRVTEICTHLHDRLAENVELDGKRVQVNASIGIAHGSFGDYECAEDMLRDADVSMYAEKNNGGTPSRNQLTREDDQQQTLNSQIPSGIENGEFVLHYQPIFNSQTLELTGFEALLRWQHPTRGLIAPLEFIPTAEKTGLIVPLGKHVLMTACKQLRAWQLHFPVLAKQLSINVNLSTRQVAEPTLLESFRSIVAESGISAASINLEITETLLLNDCATATNALSELNEDGFSVVLDDFGVGFSSLGYLNQLPVSTLKIDRSFVKDLFICSYSHSIVRLVLSLADELNMTVVAEGVETEEQAELLRAMKCDMVQGFLYAKPVDAVAAAKFIVSPWLAFANV